MLKSLRIRNVAVIADVAIDFGPGLNVLTGETGAGKSIVVDSLALAAGDRCEAGRVRTGEERAVVEALFSVAEGAPVGAALAARGLDDAGGELAVRRDLSSQGGSRAFVNGSPTTLGVLREIVDSLVELHGQHEHQDLLLPERHLELLDQFGGLAEAVRRVGEAFEAVTGAHERLDRLRASARDAESRADSLRRSIAEIDAAAPRPGELEGLDRDRRILQSAGRMAAFVDDVARLLYEGEPSAAALAAAAARRAADAAGIDPSLREIAERIEAARLEIQDAGAAFRDYRERSDFDPARLEAAEARRAVLERLRARYGGDEGEIVAHRDACARELSDLEDLDGAIREAEEEVGRAQRRYAEEAAAVSASRREAAERLAKAVRGELRPLAMERARLVVRFEAARGPGIEGAGPEPVPLSRRGGERAEFLLSANPGEDPRPLSRIASGGELSRVMLALHVILEGAGRGRVLVFDEVDAGVGGAVADAVGARLARLAERHQVLCVTHLPQVAAHAEHHYHVRKRVAAGRTIAEVERLGEADRLDELARMLGGRGLTAAARRNAADLLAAAASRPRSRGRRLA